MKEKINNINKIKKIEKKFEVQDVKGEGCRDDCITYKGNVSAEIGCSPVFSCNLTCFL